MIGLKRVGGHQKCCRYYQRLLHHEEAADVPERVHIHEGEELRGKSGLPLLGHLDYDESAQEDHG